MFKSSPLTTHLLRGAAGLLCFAGALSGALPLWAALPLPFLGLLALRGCPLCWLAGLAESLRHRRQDSPRRSDRPTLLTQPTRNPDLR